jgi:hypothetical protein
MASRPSHKSTESLNWRGTRRRGPWARLERGWHVQQVSTTSYARSRSPPPLVLWNGIKMGITLLERVLWHERGGVIGACLLLQPHGDVEGARGLVTNLNVGVEERHVATVGRGAEGRCPAPRAPRPGAK